MRDNLLVIEPWRFPTAWCKDGTVQHRLGHELLLCPMWKYIMCVSCHSTSSQLRKLYRACSKCSMFKCSIMFITSQWKCAYLYFFFYWVLWLISNLTRSSARLIQLALVKSLLITSHDPRRCMIGFSVRKLAPPPPRAVQRVLYVAILSYLCLQFSTVMNIIKYMVIGWSCHLLKTV